MRSIFALAAISTFGLFGTAQAGDCSEGPTIVDLAVATPSLSTLVEAAVKADLVDTLSQNRNYTVFAPTNDAFDAAAEALVGPGTTGSELVAALSVDELTAVLLYHVTNGSRESGSVLNARQIRMLDGNFTVPSLQGGAPFINAAPIEGPDVGACNGVVHVIGGVLLPPTT